MKTMEVKNIYGQSKVVILNVGQEDVDGLLINWDFDDSGKKVYMEKDFVSSVMNYLPEYSMGYDTDGTQQTRIIGYLREVANGVIKIKRINEIRQYLDQKIPHDQWDPDILKTYRTKGVFSELILHFILRDFKHTIPLISKVYFKDSNAIEAHGFDAVHVSDDILWLGETKFYNNGEGGIKALVNDLNNHFKKDFSSEERDNFSYFSG